MDYFPKPANAYALETMKNITRHNKGDIENCLNWLSGSQMLDLYLTKFKKSLTLETDLAPCDPLLLTISCV